MMMNNDNDNDNGKVDAAITGATSNNVPCTEMTQDVIEWDESRNLDLRNMYRSPHPPTRGSSSRYSSASKAAAGSKMKTPATSSSTKTTNSSLFLHPVKCELNHQIQNDVRRSFILLPAAALEAEE